MENSNGNKKVLTYMFIAFKVFFGFIVTTLLCWAFIVGLTVNSTMFINYLWPFIIIYLIITVRLFLKGGKFYALGILLSIVINTILFLVLLGGLRATNF